MPNYVSHRVIAHANTKEDLDRFIDFLHREDVATDYEGNEHRYVNEFSFMNVLPSPEDMVSYKSSRAEEAQEYIEKNPNFFTKGLIEQIKMGEAHIDLPERLEEKDILDGISYIESTKKYGYPNTYEWCWANWGTKWDSSDAVVQRDGDTTAIFTFDTAWSTPIPVFQALAKMFKKIRLDIIWADENTGYNTGMGVAEGGTYSFGFAENFSKEAYNISFELNPWQREYYEYDGETYSFKED